MRSLSELWKDIVEKDSSFSITEEAYNRKVVIENRPTGNIKHIKIETDTLQDAILLVWKALYHNG